MISILQIVKIQKNKSVLTHKPDILSGLIVFLFIFIMHAKLASADSVILSSSSISLFTLQHTFNDNGTSASIGGFQRDKNSSQSPTPATSQSYANRSGDVLSGSWNGTLYVKKSTILNECIHFENPYYFNLLMTFGENASSLSAQGISSSFRAEGTLFIDPPHSLPISSCTNPDIASQWVIQLKTRQASVHTVGMIIDNQITFNSWEGAPAKPYRAIVFGNEEPETEYLDYYFPAELVSISKNNFTIQSSTTIAKAGITMHFDVQGTFHRTSQSNSSKMSNSSSPFSQDEQMASFLAMLLAYMALILPGLFKNPESIELLSVIGTLLGSLEALKGLGLERIAAQARSGGFIAAAIAESVELVRIYQSSTDQGNSATKTSLRLASSLIPDVIAFVASAALMEAATEVAATAATMVGSIGAAVVAVGGAALITYGVSAVMNKAKNWLNKP